MEIKEDQQIVFGRIPTPNSVEKPNFDAIAFVGWSPANANA